MPGQNILGDCTGSVDWRAPNPLSISYIADISGSQISVFSGDCTITITDTLTGHAESGEAERITFSQFINQGFSLFPGQFFFTGSCCENAMVLSYNIPFESTADGTRNITCAFAGDCPEETCEGYPINYSDLIVGSTISISLTNTEEGTTFQLSGQITITGPFGTLIGEMGPTSEQPIAELLGNHILITDQDGWIFTLTIKIEGMPL